MCYQCGCWLPDDPMGQGNAGLDPNGKSITNATFQEAAKSMGMTEKEAKENAYNLLKKELGKEDGKCKDKCDCENCDCENKDCNCNCENCKRCEDKK